MSGAPGCSPVDFCNLPGFHEPRARLISKNLIQIASASAPATRGAPGGRERPLRGPGREGRADIGQRVSPSVHAGLWGQLLSRRTVLLVQLGSMEAAMQELQDVRLLSKGNLLEAAAREEIAGVSKLHAEYLKEMSKYGAASRRSDLQVSLDLLRLGSCVARPHGSLISGASFGPTRT